MRVLVTGHTGFKGSWLVVLLNQLGHEVFGVSDSSIASSYFRPSNYSSLMNGEAEFDISQGDLFSGYLNDVRPDCIIHLAAEALVLRAQANPLRTLSSNVLATAKLLQATSELDYSPILIVATTDKVYKESHLPGYENVESDLLAGSEVYSHSKVAVDVMAQSYMDSLNVSNWGIVRAGNVIGGGDLSPNRLLPDVTRAYFENNAPFTMRNPAATRPWQHVLDCLYGYATLMHHLSSNPGSGIWNFGPNTEDIASVGTVLEIVQDILPDLKIQLESRTLSTNHEAKYLSLNSNRAREQLNWSPKLSLRHSVEKTIEWERLRARGGDPLQITKAQVSEFLKLSNEAGDQVA